MRTGIKISIIIPVYNVEKYLKRCIESVINQTYSNLEIIIVDDGSTDDSYSICKKYAEQDSRIHLYQKQNGGLADARNYGLEKVTGNYVGYVDSDDYIELDMYEKLVALAMEYDADVVACKFKTESVGVIEEYTETRQVHLMSGGEMLSWYINKEVAFEGSFTPSVWDRIYKLECIKDIYFSKGRNYEDIVYTTQVLLNASKCVYYDYAGYIYEVRQGSIMNDKNIIRELEDELYQLKKRIEVLKENNWQRFLGKCIYDFYYFMVYKRIKYCKVNDKRVKEILKIYKKEMKSIKGEVLKFAFQQRMSISRIIGITLAYYCLPIYKRW